MTEPHPLLQTFQQKHAEAHRKMCADNATPEDVLFYKGMWLAYNDAIGEVEHSSTKESSEKVLDDIILFYELLGNVAHEKGEREKSAIFYGVMALLKQQKTDSNIITNEIAELRRQEREQHEH